MSNLRYLKLYLKRSITLNFNFTILLLKQIDIVLIVVVSCAHLPDIIGSGLKYLSARRLKKTNRKAIESSKDKRERVNNNKENSTHSNLFAFDIGNGVAEAVKAVLDVIAPLAFERIVMGALAVGLGHLIEGGLAAFVRTRRELRRVVRAGVCWRVLHHVQ